MDPIQVPVWLVALSLFLHLLLLGYIALRERKITSLYKTQTVLLDGIKSAREEMEDWQKQFTMMHDWLLSFGRDLLRAKDRALDKRRDGGSATVPGGTVADWLTRVHGLILWQKMTTGEIDLWQDHTWVRQEKGKLSVFDLKRYVPGLTWLCHEAHHPHRRGPLSLLPQNRDRTEITEALLALQEKYERSQAAQKGSVLLTDSEHSDNLVKAVRDGEISPKLKAAFAPHHEQIAALRFYWGAGGHFNINLTLVVCGKMPQKLDNAETARVHQVIEWMFDELLNSPSPA